jgi:hypothetical protein
MTSDMSKINSGLGPSSARLQILIARASELHTGMALMSSEERHRARSELKDLLPQISGAARETADGIEASVGRCR